MRQKWGHANIYVFYQISSVSVDLFFLQKFVNPRLPLIIHKIKGILARSFPEGVALNDTYPVSLDEIFFNVLAH